MKNPFTILTIEDDSAIRRGIVDALEFNGYDVTESADGNSGRRKAVDNEYDLVLLDLGLPGVSGMEILRSIREIRPSQPVIILTAKGEENDRVQGLREGADDYVVKPFSVKELMARVEAVLRRSSRKSIIETTPFDAGVIDFERREIRYEDQTRTELSEKEVDLLKYLSENSGRAISRDELLANVWKISPRGLSTRTIDMHIARLREKLHDNSDSPNLLLTVRGKGYMWMASPEANA